MAAELQREGKLKCYPWTLVHIDNAKSHMSNWNLAGMEKLCFKCTADLASNPDIVPSDFFFLSFFRFFG
jgi:hypothetical protein